LQRLFEWGEDRFLQNIWKRYKLVHDVDNTRRDGYGGYYNKRNAPTAERLKSHPGI